ncbi:MAG: hypothetical protein N838_14625 [Thiohalocapsa sp. PB-PSB1]|nr:MAG: hypothetical protein N838_14625 [Thiohalocapsa sp. PB-PSB1]
MIILHTILHFITIKYKPRIFDTPILICWLEMKGQGTSTACKLR